MSRVLNLIAYLVLGLGALSTTGLYFVGLLDFESTIVSLLLYVVIVNLLRE